MPVILAKVEEYLQKEMQISDYLEKDSALNGVQVSRQGEVNSLCLAVDFCQETLDAAIMRKADAMLVHHGMYWGKAFAITGRYYAWIKKLITHNIALIALHLPLDMHEKWGNNIGLIEALSLKYLYRFGDYRGLKALFMAESQDFFTLKDFVENYQKSLGNPLFVIDSLPKNQKLRRVAVCSGGGLFGVEAAKKAGADVLLTGDTNHTVYHLAKEIGISVVSGGHYLTETLGVKRLGKHLGDVFGLETFFCDCPTGL